MLTLSICIPSYNRFERLKKTIIRILKSKSNDFEIVVVDNCSPRNINEIIDIEDERLRIVHREKAVSGITNVNTCIMYGNAKFSLLLLDKDSIDGDKISEFITYLNKTDVVGGYCVINSNASMAKVYAINALEKFGFLSKHPSGNFYKMDVLKNYVNKMNDKLLLNPFGFDVWLSYCANAGNMLLYDKVLVESSLSNIDKDDKKSFTYSTQNDNIYYFPKNRIRQFILYCECLCDYNINKYRKMKNVHKLYLRTLKQISLQYKIIMADERVCSHYGHAQKEVTKKEIGEYFTDLREAFLNNSFYGLNYISKNIVILTSELLIRIYLLLKL